MRHLTSLLFLAVLAQFAGSIFAQPSAPLPDAEATLHRIAFGSCTDEELPQPIWDAIAGGEPQLFLALGDNVYADTLDPSVMAAAYAEQGAVPEFARFRSRVPILATWDDHDYGTNDGGAGYPMKDAAERLFLDFWDVPEDDPRRLREGVYGAWAFGPPGRRVQVILLDGRTFRSPLEDDPSPYWRWRPSLDPEKTMLGEAQWQWLEEMLREPAELRLVGSGVQVLGYNWGFESWKQLPLELERLFALVRETEAAGVVFLSGDAHFGQIKLSDGGFGYPAWDFTSSGLTHSRPASAERPSALAVHQPYGGLNFGTVEIDWGEADPVVSLVLRDGDGVRVFRQEIRLSELQPRREVMD